MNFIDPKKKKKQLQDKQKSHVYETTQSVQVRAE